MITGSNIIGVLIFLLLSVIFFGFLKFPKTKIALPISAMVLIVMLIIYFSVSNSYLFKQDEIVDSILKVQAKNIDSIEVANYVSYGSFDYTVDYYIITDTVYINSFFKILNKTPHKNTEINFRKYPTIRDFRVVMYPEIFKNSEIKIFTLKGLGTFVTVKINEDKLIYAPNEEFAPLIDTIIKKSKPFKRIEKHF